jgi:hypothetical protein
MPEDLTGTLAFLVSDDAAFYTGQVTNVDGGGFGFGSERSVGEAAVPLSCGGCVSCGGCPAGIHFPPCTR